MPKTLTFEFPESDVAELETILAQMQSANDQMRRDQAEIDELKRETQAMATQTRRILDQLEVNGDVICMSNRSTNNNVLF